MVRSWMTSAHATARAGVNPAWSTPEPHRVPSTSMVATRRRTKASRLHASEVEQGHRVLHVPHHGKDDPGLRVLPIDLHERAVGHERPRLGARVRLRDRPLVDLRGDAEPEEVHLLEGP